MPPLQSTHYVVVTVKPRAGLAPPLPRGTFIYCPVGRGDPTPPGNLMIVAIFRDDVVFPAGL